MSIRHRSCCASYDEPVASVSSTGFAIHQCADWRPDPDSRQRCHYFDPSVWYTQYAGSERCRGDNIIAAQFTQLIQSQFILYVLIHDFLFSGNLVFSFRAVNPDVQVSYAGTGSGTGRGSVIEPNKKDGDFAGSNTIFTKIEVATAAKNKRTMLSLVSSVSAIVLPYNLPLPTAFVRSLLRSFLRIDIRISLTNSVYSRLIIRRKRNWLSTVLRLLPSSRPT